MPAVCRKCEKVFQVFAKKVGMVCFLKDLAFFTSQSTKLSAKSVLYLQVPIIFILFKNSYIRNELVFHYYFSVTHT